MNYSNNDAVFRIQYLHKYLENYKQTHTYDEYMDHIVFLSTDTTKKLCSLDIHIYCDDCQNTMTTDKN
jgi:hypothetical protein